jgi:hypothetical protein
MDPRDALHPAHDTLVAFGLGKIDDARGEAWPGLGRVAVPGAVRLDEADPGERPVRRHPRPGRHRRVTGMWQDAAS